MHVFFYFLCNKGFEISPALLQWDDCTHCFTIVWRTKHRVLGIPRKSVRWLWESSSKTGHDFRGDGNVTQILWMFNGTIYPSLLKSNALSQLPFYKQSYLLTKCCLRLKETRVLVITIINECWTYFRIHDMKGRLILPRNLNRVKLMTTEFMRWHHTLATIFLE